MTSIVLYVFKKKQKKGLSEDDEAPEESKAQDDAEAVGARRDGLREELKKRQREANQ
jgi:hypothetical protein